MMVEHIVGWSAVAAVVSWRLAWRRARAMIKWVRAQAHAESEHWKAEAVRWRANSARLAKEIEAWKVGHLEGRADVVSIVPLLIAVQPERAGCSCRAAGQNT
jgi:hypothetical protein